MCHHFIVPHLSQFPRMKNLQHSTILFPCHSSANHASELLDIPNYQALYFRNLLISTTIPTAKSLFFLTTNRFESTPTSVRL